MDPDNLQKFELETKKLALAHLRRGEWLRASEVLRYGHQTIELIRRLINYKPLIKEEYGNR